MALLKIRSHCVLVHDLVEVDDQGREDVVARLSSEDSARELYELLAGRPWSAAVAEEIRHQRERDHAEVTARAGACRIAAVPRRPKSQPPAPLPLVTPVDGGRSA